MTITEAIATYGEPLVTQWVTNASTAYEKRKAAKQAKPAKSNIREANLLLSNATDEQIAQLKQAVLKT